MLEQHYITYTLYVFFLNNLFNQILTVFLQELVPDALPQQALILSFFFFNSTILFYSYVFHRQSEQEIVLCELGYIKRTLQTCGYKQEL